MGYELCGTTGTAKLLAANGIACARVRRASEMRPNIATMLTGGDIMLIINTPGGAEATEAMREDFYELRQLAVAHRVTNCTTLSQAQAMVEAIERAREGSLGVVALQDLQA
jgi:carbamoyl-phosphate synthase large subunit